MEAKGFAQRLEIAERMNYMVKNEAFVTLNDQKHNFSNALPCRLTIPAKSDIGRISKTTLNRILTAVNQKLQLTMWKNNAAVTMPNNACRQSGYNNGTGTFCC